MESLKSSQIEPGICKLNQEKKWEDLNRMEYVQEIWAKQEEVPTESRSFHTVAHKMTLNSHPVVEVIRRLPTHTSEEPDNLLEHSNCACHPEILIVTWNEHFGIMDYYLPVKLNIWTSNNKNRSPGNIEKWLLAPDAHKDKCHTPTSLYKTL
jgi:hypothetical protein